MPAPALGLGEETGVGRETPLVGGPPIDLGATLGWYRIGAGDPTTWMTVVGRGPRSSGRFVRASITPDGPGTIELAWGSALADATADGSDLPESSGWSDVDGVPGLRSRAFGPGARWICGRAAAMAGAHDRPDRSLETAPDVAIADAARTHRALRFGASGDLYHELLPNIIGQRITVGEAYAQWRDLCRALGERAPGPFEALLLPPAARTLSRQPSWSFHRLGIERKRAEPLIELAKHPLKLWEWARLPPPEAAAMLGRLRGIGPWTIGSVLGPALGDPDALAVGDYHLKNIVGWALAGEARATDARMLELLEPYRGQRGRVARILKMNGNGAPKFGPKQRILPMRDW